MKVEKKYTQQNESWLVNRLTAATNLNEVSFVFVIGFLFLHIRPLGWLSYQRFTWLDIRFMLCCRKCACFLISCKGSIGNGTSLVHVHSFIVFPDPVSCACALNIHDYQDFHG